MFDILYTIILTLFIMVLLHHLYNYLQTNLTVPKVNEVHPTILQDLQELHKEVNNELNNEINNEINNESKQNNKNKEHDELKEYLNQFKKK
jgi:hypothetical protein